MVMGSLIEEMEIKKKESRKIGAIYSFLAAKRPNFRFTRQERDQRLGLVQGLLDIGKTDSSYDISPIIHEVDRALWRIGFNQLKDLWPAAKVRQIRKAVAYDRPKRGRPRKK